MDIHCVLVGTARYKTSNTVRYKIQELLLTAARRKFCSLRAKAGCSTDFRESVWSQVFPLQRSSDSRYCHSYWHQSAFDLLRKVRLSWTAWSVPCGAGGWPGGTGVASLTLAVPEAGMVPTLCTGLGTAPTLPTAASRVLQGCSGQSGTFQQSLSAKPSHWATRLRKNPLALPTAQRGV